MKVALYALLALIWLLQLVEAMGDPFGLGGD